MTLSEAIRLGAMVKPQAFGQLSRDGGTCALGAALDAISAALDDSDWAMARATLQHAFPIVLQRACCPVCGGVQLPVSVNVMHLNDEHLWTREAIADWVETVERSHEPTAVVELMSA